MKLPTRTFTSAPAKRERVPLIIGLTGPSGSGKTYSALELATGIQTVVGGDIYVVDTESKRAAHYADYFKFIHVPFDPPFGPLDYLAAFKYCSEKGARIIVADSMSHEHDGDGGVMDQVDKILDDKCGENWEKRLTYNQVAHARVKPARKVLNRYIVQNGDIVWILCYRAQDKIKPLKKGQKSDDGEKIIHLGWQPITTSPLVFDMTARFLLTPGSEGRPVIKPEEDAEKMLVKNPRQFAGWINGEQITRDLGAKMAKWAAGDDAVSTPRAPTVDDVFSAIKAAGILDGKEWLGKQLGREIAKKSDIRADEIPALIKAAEGTATQAA